MDFTRVVARGVDTLVLFTTAPVRPGVVEQLAELKGRARDLRQPAPWGELGVDLEVASHGAGGGRFLASSDMWALKVNPDTVDDTTPTVTVEVRALALWSLGWRRAGARAVELLRACTVESVPVMAQVSRVDLCVDWQGWVPSPGDRGWLHSRARKRSRHWVDDPTGWQWTDNDAGRQWLKRERSRVVSLARQLERAENESQQRALLRQLLHLEDVAHAEHDDGRHFTGFSIGAGGALSARIYDKRREAETRAKTWFEGVWRRAEDYNPEATVWRLEYQLRREGLRSMKLEHPEGDFSPGAWETFSANVGSVWKYLAREWLYHGTRTAEVRGALSPHWSALADVEGWAEQAEVLDLHREAAQGQGTRLVAGLAGYLSSAAALLVEQREDDDAPPDFGSVINQVLGAAYTHAQRAEKESTDDPASGMERRYRRKLLRLRARRVEPRTASAASLRREWLERAREGIGPGQWVRYGFHPAGAQTAAHGGQLVRFEGNDERAWRRALQDDRTTKALNKANGQK